MIDKIKRIYYLKSIGNSADKQRRKQMSGFTFNTKKIAKTMNIRKATAYRVLGKANLGLFSKRRDAKEAAKGSVVIKSWTFKDANGKHFHRDRGGRNQCRLSIITRTMKIKRLRELRREVYGY
jgi:hypothetical protein